LFGEAGINAAWMQTYIRGVSCPDVCAKEYLNHAVLLVGFTKFQIVINLGKLK